MTQISWLGEVAWKATAILAAAFVAAMVLRRASAAARHFLWTEVLAALLLLPVVMSVTPKWITPSVLPTANSSHAGDKIAGATVTTIVVRPEGTSVPWLWLWAIGAGVAAVRFGVGAYYTRRMVWRSRAANYARGMAAELTAGLGVRRRVAVLEADVPVPLACGLLRPAVVLPRGAAAWPATRLAMVLRHELAHIRRWDLAAQSLGQVVCCLYWFHPLVWLTARRLRQERERACDDAVLAAGVPAHDYAADLVDLARGMASRRATFGDAPAMAEACDLESRVRALFDARNRRPLGLKVAVAIELGVLALLVPLASFTMKAQAPRGALVGVVLDPSGARVPNARVVANNDDISNQEQTKANPAGEYSFAALPAGQYLLEIASPGFKLLKVNATVIAGQATRVDGRLELGAISEGVTVRGIKPPVVTPNTMRTTERIRIGGNVQMAQLVQQAKPEYPAELQQAGVQGTVVIQTIITKDGDVGTTKVLSTQVDPRLVQLALNALKQWRYQPSLLNGEPVEVMTTVSIDFTLN
jgi:TonB family protein